MEMLLQSQLVTGHQLELFCVPTLGVFALLHLNALLHPPSLSVMKLLRQTGLKAFSVPPNETLTSSL